MGDVVGGVGRGRGYEGGPPFMGNNGRRSVSAADRRQCNKKQKQIKKETQKRNPPDSAECGLWILEKGAELEPPLRGSSCSLERRRQ